jgi:predicted permease
MSHEPPAHPPEVLRRILGWVLPPGPAREGLLGDLDELYAERAERGPIAADLWYARQVISAGVHYTARRAGLGDSGGRMHQAMPDGGPGPASSWTGLASDFALAARTLLRTPSFTAAAVGTLALGIGANAAIFGLVDELLLRPPPYERPDELVLVWATLGPSGDAMAVPAPDAAVVEERSAALEGLAFMGRSTDATLARMDDETPEHVRLAGVTSDFFEVLGVSVARGRGFLYEEEAAASPASGGGPDGLTTTGPPAVLISDSAWRRVFTADPSLPGRTVRLNARPVVVLGVLPPDFRMMLPPWSGIDAEVDVWMPLRIPLAQVARGDGRLVDQDTDNTGAVVGRLAPWASLEHAQEELDLVSADLRAEAPGYAAKGYHLSVRPLHEDVTAHARGLLLALLAGAVGVLVVASLSVSALLLARGLSRERELAVRAALGASRWLLARHLLAEVILVLVAGGALALVVAAEGGRALSALVPEGLAPSGGAAPIGRRLIFALAATAAMAPLFGLIALLQGRLLVGSGRAGALLTRGRFRRGRAREALVVAEVAVSLVLVAAAGLLVRAAHALSEVQPGFRAEGALGFDVSVRVDGAYTGPADRARLVRSLEEAVGAVPGVGTVGLTNALPLSGRRWMLPWGLPGQPPAEWGGAGRADFRMVTSPYFEAAGTRLLEGRTFTSDEDLEERQRVVIVDEVLARRIAEGGATAVGAQVGIPLDGRPVEARVVGVVEDVRNDDLATPGRGTIYVPYRQEASRDVSFVVRTEGDPTSLAPAVRRAVLAVEPRLAVYRMRTLDDFVRAELAPTLFGVAMLSAYALLALLAAALGLYGVVAWDVGRRTRDLGVRMAVGATAAEIRRSVLANGLALAVLGVLCGGALALLALGGLRRLVHGVPLTDPLTWAAAVAVIVAVTLLACWVPAARAARLDPVEALRSD